MSKTIVEIRETLRDQHGFTEESLKQSKGVLSKKLKEI